MALISEDLALHLSYLQNFDTVILMEITLLSRLQKYLLYSATIHTAINYFIRHKLFIIILICKNTRH